VGKPWEHKPARRPAATASRRRVLILCEDSKSSCYYIRSFPFDPRRVELIVGGTGRNCDDLVAEAIRLTGIALKEGRAFNDVWCVFDRDAFPLANYHRAFELAHSNSIKVAWSNEAFELWYLLHFNYHDTGICRDDYKAKLRACGLTYDKASDLTYDLIKDRQQTAIKFAKKLERFWNEQGVRNPERQNPSTNVHRLVEFLNDLSDLGMID
jgi:hypothetical protein